jgi:hypothetical protein
VRLRKTLIDQRTAWQQRIHAQLFHQGAPGGLKLRTQAGREALSRADLSPAGRELVELGLRMLDSFDHELAPLDRQLRTFARRQPGCRALIEQLYGVGPVSATAILAELGRLPPLRLLRRRRPPRRPRRHRLPLGRETGARPSLSHQRPAVLRWALYEAAVSAARDSSPDRGYYLQVAARLDHNRACLSVARKLCRRAYHILRELGDDALAPIEQPAAEKEIVAAAA